MEKPSAKKVLGLVVLLGLVATLVIYFMIYRKWNEDAHLMDNSNAQLNRRVNELYDHYQKIDDYNAQIDLIKADIDKIVEEFPADVREEDVLLLALQIRDKAPVVYEAINIAEREALVTVDAQTIKNAGVDSFTGDVMFVKRQTALTGTFTYEDLKSMVDTINDTRYRRCINRVEVQRNLEENYLEGVAEITFYSLAGTGKEYEEVKFTEFPTGLTNLFGLVTVTEDSEELEEEVTE